MKNFIYSILVFLLISLLSTNLRAQVLSSYGLKAGACIASQNWEYHNLPDYMSGLSVPVPSDEIVGIDISIFTKTKYFSIFCVTAEIHYIEKGRKITVMGTIQADNPQGYEETGPITINERFSYISVPILLEMKLLKSYLSPYLLLGPRLEYLINYPNSLLYDEFNKMDFGITMGIGIEFNIRFIKSIILEGRFSPNLSNSYKNEYVTVKNSSIEILIGVVI